MNSVAVGLIFTALGNQIFDFFFKSKEFGFYPFGITAAISAIISSLSSVYVNYLRNRQNLKNFTYFSLSTFFANRQNSS
jgi:hypothetical protein